MKVLNISTSKTTEMIDITSRVQSAIREMGIENGACLIFVPHTTAGITINENADPDVRHDILKEINKIVPMQDNYKHIEGNSAAHIKASLMGFSELVIVEGGRLVLGTWQGIYLCEFDGPRSRKVYVKPLYPLR